MKNQKESRGIIIIKMYTGSYLSAGNNIGHEIINLYKADDTGDGEKNYIYLTSTGTVKLSSDNTKIIHKNHNIETNVIGILLVRSFGPSTYKVLGRAKGIKPIPSANSKYYGKNPSIMKGYDEQVNLKLSYGGKKLVKILKDNRYHEEPEREKICLATFTADKVTKPFGNKPIYLTDQEDKESVANNTIYIPKNFTKSSLRQYFLEEAEDTKTAFNVLNEIINDETLWDETDETTTVTPPTGLEPDENFNFMKIMGLEDYELAFSNMFFYFFDTNRDVFLKFAKEFMDIDIEETFKIKREENNIDLLIVDEKNVIIIENKIKSGINGIKLTIEPKAGEPVKSQLDRYYSNVYERYIEKEDASQENIKCVIFSPNYNNIDLNEYLQGDKYKIIDYEKIYHFFNDNRELFNVNDYQYLDEFIKAMYKHTKPVDKDLEEEMQRRFKNAIYNAKK